MTMPPDDENGFESEDGTPVEQERDFSAAADPDGEDAEWAQEPGYIENTDGEGQLLLADEDENLPWLENDEEYEDTGVDTARIVWFVLAALLALAAVIGGIYFATRSAGSGDVTPDGSTIAAPEGPIKSRPEDPGGKQFEGTGDTAFRQGEGESTEGRIAEDDAPRPGVDARRTGEQPDAAPSASANAGQATGTSGVGVQVGAYSTKAGAEEGWRTLAGRSEALSGVKYRIVEGQADIGTVYRLQAVAGSRDAADALCDRLKNDGVACQVKP
jgi:hypothetical protein